MIYTVEHHAALKRKTILIHAVKWMNLYFLYIHTHICFEIVSFYNLGYLELAL